MSLEAQLTAADAWRQIIGNARQQKNSWPAVVAELQAGNSSIERIFTIYRSIKQFRDELEAYKATSNLNAYVSDVRNDALYDAVAEVSAVTALMQTALDWVDSNAAGINLSGDTAANWVASGSVATNRFSAAQTSGLQSALQAIVVQINTN